MKAAAINLDVAGLPRSESKVLLLGFDPCRAHRKSSNKNYMLRIFLGILVVVGGFLIVWQSEWLYRNLGPVDWAERKLGTEGGTRLYYKLIGIAIIILGLFIVSGIWYDLLNGLASLLGARPR